MMEGPVSFDRPGGGLTVDPDSDFRIVVAGEFNSGKSSLINLLLRRQVIAPSVNYSHMPPLQIALQDGADFTPEITLVAQNGACSASETLPDRTDTPQGLARIVMRTGAGGLAGASIIEVSVDEGGSLSPTSAAELHNADLIVWCTMGQRAWCLSEMTVVESLPPKRLEGAILAVTRADYLDAEARGRVMQRVTELAGGTFARTVMVDASRAALDAADDETRWTGTGGQEIHALLQAAIAAGRQRRAGLFLPSHSTTAPEVLDSDAAIHRAWAAEMESIRHRLQEPRSRRHAPYDLVLRGLDRLAAKLPAQVPEPPALAAIFRQAQRLLSNTAADGDGHALALDLAIQLQDRFAPPDP